MKEAIRINILEVTMWKSYFSQGNQLLRENNLEEAIAAYQNSIQQNPNFYWAHHNLGEALERLGQLKEAVTAYQQAIELMPEAAWSHFNLSRVLYQLGHTKNAEKASERAIEIEPRIKKIESSKRKSNFSKNFLNKHNFKPCYVWPFPVFPFWLYYNGSKCRIFMIVNIQHNWEWMSKWHEHFRKTDFFLVRCGCYHSPSFIDEIETIFSILDLDKTQFFFLCNSPKEKALFTEKGFQGEVINQNAWIDENLMQPLNLDKIYNAIYVGRRSAVKRHMLASKVSRLALVAGNNHGRAIAPIPPHDYLNDKPLSPKEVCKKINQAYCGLILSEAEGGCFASSEYLLCGVPVVSTPSKGGRDVWYNEYNSIICEPTPDAVASAVEEFVRSPRDPQRIRKMHLEQAQIYRNRFIQLLTDIFHRFGVVDIDPGEYFKANFCHKLKQSCQPNFQEIFGSKERTVIQK